MNLKRDRIHTIGWGTALAMALAVTAGVGARVSAEKSQAQLAERQITALRQETLFLQTEFETRANQQALKQLNDVDFGYEAPTSAQYLESERQLAALAKPAAPDAPAPVRFASAEGDDAGTGNGAAQAPASVSAQGAGFAGLASRMMGTAVAAEVPPSGLGTHKPASPALLRASLRQRLSHVDETLAEGVVRE